MSNRLKISVYVITYNEEKKIKDCLESIKWADEIVVIDSFSTDKTIEICEAYTDKIFQKKFEGFGNLRNFALKCVSNNWVLSIDSDERSTEELKREILQLLLKGPEADAYFVPRKNYFFGKFIKHSGWYPNYRQPQFFNKNKMRYCESDLVHEAFELKDNGKIGYLKGHIIQYPFLSLDEFLRKMDRYSTLRAKQMHIEKKKFRFYQIITHPLSCFLKMYFLKLGFCDGKQGLLLALLYTYYTLIKYAKFWEIYLNEKNK